MKLKAALVMMLLCALVVAGCDKKEWGKAAPGGKSDECPDICDKYTGDEYKRCTKKCAGDGTAHEVGSSGKCPAGFAYIPPGEFTMGSPSYEGGREDDELQHRVTISRGFCMGAYEVTQGKWGSVMGGNPSNFKDCGSNCPVENVSWDDAQEFIEKYNSLHGGGYRLPTEAEWEYAARAGTTTAFYTGDITNVKNVCGRDSALYREGWYCGNSGVSYSGCGDVSSWGGPECAGTQPVGKKEANAWGLYDMHGNVWEWVADWYGDYPSGTVTDPTGPSSGSGRGLRGGGWFFFARCCRAADRGWSATGVRSDNLGFRLARTVQ